MTYRSRLVDTAYYPNGLVAQGTDTVSCGWVPAYAFCNETNRGNVGCLWYASGYAGTATHGKNRLLVSYDNGATFSQVATQNCNDSTGLCGNGASVATDDGACSAHPDSDIMYKSVLLDDTDEETVIAEHVSYVNCNLAMYYEPHATIACTYENWGWGNCSYSAWGYEGTAWNGQSILDVSVDGGSYSTLETKYCNDDSGWCESGQKNDYSACYGQPLGTPVTYRVRMVDSSDPETTLASATKDLTCGMPGVTGGPTGTVGYDSASFTFNTYGGDAIACRIDGGSWNSCTSPDEYQDLDPGAHTWDVRATVNSPSGVAISSMSWFIDLDAPTVAFTSPENNAETIASHILVFGTIDGTGTDGMAVSVNGTYCSVHGGSTWRCDVPLTVGTNYLTATGYDGAWNSANAYLTVVRN